MDEHPFNIKGVFRFFDVARTAATRVGLHGLVVLIAPCGNFDYRWCANRRGVCSEVKAMRNNNEDGSQIFVFYPDGTWKER